MIEPGKILSKIIKLGSLVSKYKKALIALTPLYALLIWLNAHIDSFKEDIDNVKKIPEHVEKFSLWASDIDSSINLIDRKITIHDHMMIGELTQRRVGKIKMFLNNYQETKDLPLGGFIYNAKNDDFVEVFWSNEAADYYINNIKKTKKGGKIYFKKIKIYLNYDTD